jgi:hypothetical protein
MIRWSYVEVVVITFEIPSALILSAVACAHSTG